MAASAHATPRQERQNAKGRAGLHTIITADRVMRFSSGDARSIPLGLREHMVDLMTRRGSTSPGLRGP
jgi:hypothetical protein